MVCLLWPLLQMRQKFVIFSLFSTSLTVLTFIFLIDSLLRLTVFLGQGTYCTRHDVRIVTSSRQLGWFIIIVSFLMCSCGM